MEYTIQLLNQIEDCNKLLIIIESQLTWFGAKQNDLMRKREHALKKNQSLQEDYANLSNKLGKFFTDATGTNDTEQYRTVLSRYKKLEKEYTDGLQKYSGPEIVKRELVLNCLERKIDEAIRFVFIIQKKRWRIFLEIHQ